MLKPLLIATLAGTSLLLGGALFATTQPDRSSALERYAGNTASSAPPTQPIERLDLIETVRSAPKPRVGAVAEDLDATDEIGARFHLTTKLDRPFLFGAFCSCGVCRRTAARWSELHARYFREFSAGALLALPKGDAVFEFHDSLQVNFPLVPDQDHALSARYPGEGAGSAALECPRAWVIGKDGRYRYVMPQGSEPTPEVLRNICQALGLRNVPAELFRPVE